MPSRRRIRLAFVVVLLLSVAVLANGAMKAPTTASTSEVPRPEPRDNATVVTESARFGTIIAWNPDGSLLYYEDEHTKYYDVDRVPNTSMTVEYAATDTIHTEGPTCSSPPCTRNVVERVNLSTGEVTEIYARYDHDEYAGEWHDHERVNETHILVADMIEDQVFMVNTETEIIEWMWDAQSDYPVEGGGPYPDDWAHLNDVELLDDGRVMVSMRNQDQVAFIDRETGVVENWTLGSEDDHETLYEQHNPDYIPEERGGPAVLVADSENARIIEYQREGEGWTKSWEWSDDEMQWPRDADRLPNGNTLITDTNGKRLIEVNQQGEIVWEVPLSHPYDAERLGTGPESSTGESARHLGLESRTSTVGSDDGFSLLAIIRDLVRIVIPARIFNAVIFVAPVWMGRAEFFAAFVGILASLGWIGFELKWWLPDFELRSPVVRKDR
ncbi:arylsulfotransferase (asst) [Halobacteriales archaeon QS_1_68_20]|nr:MAG: arylsulfotransferase (asst) [Halobacteriales archaeon QS_1_68_20]